MLYSEFKDAEIELKDYELHRCDRVGGKGGGALLYIHNYFQTNECKGTNGIGFQESAWRIIKLNDENKILVGFILLKPIR